MVTIKMNLSRRMIGLLIGVVMGFLYSLISSTINLVFIHDVPLFIDSDSIIAQIVWGTIAGGLMGFIVNFPESGFLGVLVASLLGSITIFIESVIRATNNFGSFGLILVALFYLIPSLAAYFIPLNALFRWATNRLLQDAHQPWWKWRSLQVYLVIIGISVIVGSLPLYSPEAHSALRAMNEMIREVQTVGPENAPWSFKTVAGIVYQADDQYRLEWTDNLQRFPFSFASQDNTGGQTFQVVFAYFESGETIACLFKNDATLNLCTSVR
jgi:hypothetical protein